MKSLATPRTFGNGFVPRRPGYSALTLGGAGVLIRLLDNSLY